MSSEERIDSARMRVLSPVGFSNIATARHIARSITAIERALEPTAAYLVFPGEPWPLVFSGTDPANAPVGFIETALTEAATEGADIAGVVETGCPDPRFVRRLAIATIVGARSCVLVVFGDARFTPDGGRLYIVGTLLENLAALSSSETSQSRTLTFADRLRIFESVVANANDAVLITESHPIDDPGPRILWANEAFTRTTGYALADVVGKTPRILQGPQSARGPLDRVRTALENDAPVNVELLNYKKDGTTFWAELNIVPVPDENGRPTHWVSVQRDITERHAAAETARRATLAEEQRALLEAEIRERGRVEEKLAHTAYHDELTGLPNRALFTLRLEASLATISTNDESGISLLFMDLDKFKFVNDSLGHRIGDLLLIDVAGRLRKCLRDGDVLARMGGDEFVMLVDGPLSTAVMVAERILQVLDTTFVIEGHSISTSPSIGIAHTQTGEYSTGDLLRDADTAMYRAKLERGGSCFEVFDGTMHATAVTRLQRELDLRGALASGQFSVVYQPIVDIAEGTVEGVEALVRWFHPTEGLLMPAHFVPLAEATGDIAAIGKFVFGAACADMADRARRGCAPMRVGINVSSRELGESDAYLAHIDEVLRTTGLDPHCVQLEITEGILLSRFSRTRGLLERVRALGCRVAFDDFGTGYSNLGHLVRYPIDTLKIDRSFMIGIADEGAQRDLVRTIVSLAQTLDLGVVAEGIETREQAFVLRRLGCTMQQGLLYGPPVPAAGLDAAIAAIRGNVSALLSRDAPVRDGAARDGSVREGARSAS